MAVDRGYSTFAATFIGNFIAIADAQYERRVVIEEKGRDVIVVDEEQHVGTLRFKPRTNRREGIENGFPNRIGLFAVIQRKPDGGRMGNGDAADDGCHVLPTVVSEPFFITRGRRTL